MKVCREKDCSELNPQSKENFVKDIRYSDGHQNRCKSCQKKYDTERFKKNRTVILHRSKAYYESHIELARTKRAEYRASHKESQKILETAWRKANPGKSREKCRRYQVKKLRATPKWLTDQQIKEMQSIYENCPKGHEVDHEIPIQGKNVSGLHVPGNLKYLPVSTNRKKSNKY